ncbi:MAG: Rne/Rng family ribonuclease [Candidatus Gastranaerophilales bacterium]|nr:Rne/Rng family ribonuclease [Candidatus Gastranaerophilales bacterium]
MTKSIVISERDNIAAVLEDGKVAEFFIHRGDILLGDVYLASVENILPSIDAAFVNVGGDKMGFLHVSDVSGKGALKDRLKPKQSILVQVVKEPTGHKGPRVTTAISLPGRFLVFMPDEKGISISRKIVSAKERARLKSVVSLLKPAGVGVIIRTEAEGQSEAEIQEDLELLLEKWANITTAADTVTPPNLLYRDQDLLYRVIREACTDEVKEIIVDTPFALHRTNQLFQSWNMGSNINVSVYKGNDPLLVSKGIDREIRTALQTKVNMPSGGYLYIQTTEALTVVDVNSGKFVSSATQGETIRKTNSEAVQEIARQLRLRNIGGMIIIDFIDMENRIDQLAILVELEMALEPDKSKPQVGQLSDLGLVELTRHRQGQSLAEIFTKKCPACSGNGMIVEEFNFASPAQDGDFRMRPSKLKLPNNINKNKSVNGNQQQRAPQSQEIIKKLNNENQNGPARKINTNPSIAATAAQKSAKIEKPAEVVNNLTNEGIKQFFDTKGFSPNVSKIVRFSAIPPKVARDYMRGNLDVFSIIQELESDEIVAKDATSVLDAQNKPEAKKVYDNRLPVTAEKVMQNEDKPIQSNVQQKIVERPTSARIQQKTTGKPVHQNIPQKITEQPASASVQQKTVGKPVHRNFQHKTVERPMPARVPQKIAEKQIEENTEIIKTEAKLEAIPEAITEATPVKTMEVPKVVKKPAVRRGRKPKSENTQSLTVRRSASKAPASKEE